MVSERQEIVQKFDRMIDEFKDYSRCARISAQLLCERADAFDRIVEAQERARDQCLREYDSIRGTA